MPLKDKTPNHIKIDERNHVEKPLLDQLDGLGWNVILNCIDTVILNCIDTGTVAVPAVLVWKLKLKWGWMEEETLICQIQTELCCDELRPQGLKM